MQDAKRLGSKTDDNQVVTAVGNSWIVCKSKTYEGKTYYFNTVTGIAQWNLSDEEAERAKKRTQSLNKQSGESLKECPEPKEPPMDSSDKRSHQFIYNKKVINNSISNEPYPIATFVAPQCNYVVPSCSSGTQIGLNLPSQNYNPEVWTVPPTHQIFIAPAVSPIVSQSQMPLNVHYSDHQHITVQNTSVPLTRRFQNKSSNFNSTWHTSSKYYSRGHKFSPRNKFHHGNYQRNFRDKTNDLREHLSNKRRQRLSIEDNRDMTNANDSKSFKRREETNDEEREPVPSTSFEKKVHFQECKEDTYLSETESSWLEENVHKPGTTFKDITCLRNLAAPDADPDIWYIAVDRTILLHHLKFLNILINSDEDCQLLVPREELSALREMAGSAELAERTPRLSNRARRALNFVSQQFDSLCAVQGEELETNSNSSHILNCCLNVAEQNYHVILLSNDNELLGQKESTNIIMFSMNELKAILTKSKGHDTKEASTAAHQVGSETAIKITIPNDFSKDTDVNKTFKSISVNTEESSKQDDSKATESNIEVNSALNSLSATKVTIDTGVQTDFATPTVEVKRREIKLKRSISNQTSSNQPCSDQNTSTKQFRWRRKRNTCFATNDACNQTNCSIMNNSTSMSEDADKTSDIDSGKRMSQLSAESGKHNYDENVDHSDTSSSVFIQKNVHERITIEETSTSGVISNTTASNHDAESVTNEFSNQSKNTFYHNTIEQEDRLKNNYMFEITNPQVEECLKMRSDEWISRFVQIMEEVLTQVLQQKTPASFHLTPPPWTLQEALQCILRSSDYYGDVKDAAKKLSNTLFNISDETGKINMALMPTDFMEMYSYGVYLVDALQGLAKDSEDIQTASDSLAKLLKDIQEPNLDTSHNDALSDQNPDVSANVPVNTDEPENSVNLDSSVNEDQNTRYNLRSKRSTPRQQKEGTVKNKANNVEVEANFFTSLNLQKINSQETCECPQVREGTSQKFNFDRPSDLKIETNGSNFDNGDRLEVRLVNTKSNEVETRFVRRFSKSLEFEERLSQREPLDLDQLDYSANYEDECVEDEYYNGVEDVSDDNVSARNAKHNNEYIDQRYPTQSPDVNGNTVLYGIINTFLEEIKYTFINVQEFCKKYTDQQLRESSLSRRKTIRDKAEKLYLYVENIIKSLNSIVDREPHQYENSMHSLLMTAGIESFDLNDKLFSHYRATIVKCLDQANLLLEAVGIIMNNNCQMLRSSKSSS